MKLKDLKKELETKTETIEFNYATILKLHAVGWLMDGRGSTAKLYRKYFSPTALRIIKEHPEYK